MNRKTFVLRCGVVRTESKHLIFHAHFTLISTLKINRLSLFFSSLPSSFPLPFYLSPPSVHSFLLSPDVSTTAVSSNFGPSCCVHTAESCPQGQADSRGNQRAFRKRVDRSVNQRHVKIGASGTSDLGKDCIILFFN